MKKIGSIGMLAVVAISGALTTGATSAFAADGYQCRDQMLGPVIIAGNLTVPAGAFCDLNGTHVTGNATVERSSDPNNPAGLLLDLGARVDGNVHVEQSGQLAAFGGSVVGGNLQCDGCEVADLHDSTVSGNFHDNGLSQGADISRSRIGGNLLVQNGFDLVGFGYAFTGNSVGGNFEFLQNTGASNISGNTIGQNLDCKGNTPPPTGAGNTADHKQGQCALF
jgi:hypothetical protein